ncbi:MAG TPA: hypothetical protein VGO27_23215 [Candidatus Acidoferrum sp.]|jgi:hypothetical protein|nr:hypothetical protein [Candidatus Acidoferrum sp.]
MYKDELSAAANRKRNLVIGGVFAAFALFASFQIYSSYLQPRLDRQRVKKTEAELLRTLTSGSTLLGTLDPSSREAGSSECELTYLSEQRAPRKTLTAPPATEHVFRLRFLRDPATADAPSTSEQETVFTGGFEEPKVKDASGWTVVRFHLRSAAGDLFVQYPSKRLDHPIVTGQMKELWGKVGQFGIVSGQLAPITASELDRRNLARTEKKRAVLAQRRERENAEFQVWEKRALATIEFTGEFIGDGNPRLQGPHPIRVSVAKIEEKTSIVVEFTGITGLPLCAYSVAPGTLEQSPFSFVTAKFSTGPLEVEIKPGSDTRGEFAGSLHGSTDEKKLGAFGGTFKLRAMTAREVSDEKDARKANAPAIAKDFEVRQRIAKVLNVPLGTEITFGETDANRWKARLLPMSETFAVPDAMLPNYSLGYDLMVNADSVSYSSNSMTGLAEETEDGTRIVLHYKPGGWNSMFDSFTLKMDAVSADGWTVTGTWSAHSVPTAARWESNVLRIFGGATNVPGEKPQGAIRSGTFTLHPVGSRISWSLPRKGAPSATPSSMENKKRDSFKEKTPSNSPAATSGTVESRRDFLRQNSSTPLPKVQAPSSKNKLEGIVR